LNLLVLVCDCADLSDEQRGLESEAILSELLVLRCRRGDPQGWRGLVRLYEKRLLYYLRRLLRDESDAWDALQQTWVAAFRNLKKLREPRALRPWLYRIAHHQAIRMRRRKGQEISAVDVTGDSFALEAVADAPESSDWPAEAAERIHRGLAELSLAHREVLTLFFLERMPLDEIAQVLDLPVGTIKSRLHYAKRALREVV